VDADTLHSNDSAKLSGLIARRGLRYDLTVPFARYVVMHKPYLPFPFKRYQIQPVWRADRPQKGRYREFYQCDADVIGSDSLLYETELALIYDEVFSKLNLPVIIKVNNRKVLQGMAEIAGISSQFVDMTVAIDKLDKIGREGVRKELTERNIAPESIQKIEQFLENKSLGDLNRALSDSRIGTEGVKELESVFGLLNRTPTTNPVELDVTLARGLSYYTGCIFEVSARDFKMGSIGGGGRYADLTGVFGVHGLSGVGISFGADRIYDVLEGMQRFPENLTASIQLLLVTFDETAFLYGFDWLVELRKAGIECELYPEPGKLKKQFEYAAKRKVPFVGIIGDAEVQNKTIALKNQDSGSQESHSLQSLLNLLAPS
jgi:histidyl-tRNA synthetase